MRVALSIEAEMLDEAWGAFGTALSAVSFPAALKVTNYTEKSAISLAQKVQAYNRATPVFAGTAVALKDLLPDNSQFRYFLDDDYFKMGAVPTFNGYDVITIPQIANKNDYVNYSLALDDTMIYVLTPGTDKIVKVVVGNSLSHAGTGMFNANLNQVNSLQKSWGVGCITNSIAGYIDLDA